MREPAFDPYGRACPSRQVLDGVADRWTVLVVGALADGPMRYSDLAERVDGISQKMLTQTLRGLERDGLATRTRYAEIPPRVVYALTDAGRSLAAPLAALADWTTAHTADVLAARERFDASRACDSA